MTSQEFCNKFNERTKKNKPMDTQHLYWLERHEVFRPPPRDKSGYRDFSTCYDRVESEIIDYYLNGLKPFIVRQAKRGDL